MKISCYIHNFELKYPIQSIELKYHIQSIELKYRIQSIELKYRIQSIVLVLVVRFSSETSVWTSRAVLSVNRLLYRLSELNKRS